jgi:hypothetical protein
MFVGFPNHFTAEPAHRPDPCTARKGRCVLRERTLRIPLIFFACPALCLPRVLCRVQGEFGDLPAPSHEGAVRETAPHLFIRSLPTTIHGGLKSCLTCACLSWRPGQGGRLQAVRESRITHRALRGSASGAARRAFNSGNFRRMNLNTNATNGTNNN